MLLYIALFLKSFSLKSCPNDTSSKESFTTPALNLPNIIISYFLLIVKDMVLSWSEFRVVCMHASFSPLAGSALGRYLRQSHFIKIWHLQVHLPQELVVYCVNFSWVTSTSIHSRQFSPMRERRDDSTCLDWRNSELIVTIVLTYSNMVKHFLEEHGWPQTTVWLKTITLPWRPPSLVYSWNCQNHVHQGTVTYSMERQRRRGPEISGGS